MAWLDAPADVLAFDAEAPAFACVVNLSDSSVALPAHRASCSPAARWTRTGACPTDTAVWLRTA